VTFCITTKPKLRNDKNKSRHYSIPYAQRHILGLECDVCLLQRNNMQRSRRFEVAFCLCLLGLESIVQAPRALLCLSTCYPSVRPFPRFLRNGVILPSDCMGSQSTVPLLKPCVYRTAMNSRVCMNLRLSLQCKACNMFGARGVDG
jgi:hypothetical protein